MKPSAGGSGGEIRIGFSFKMYFGYQETLDWCTRARAIALADPGIVEGTVRLFVMPSLPYLLPVIEMFRGTPIEVGGQNLHVDDRGPFTGEVSGRMLAEIGCRLVEVGHSERRRLFGETDEVVALKVEAALRNRLLPVVCVGEGEPKGVAYACHETLGQVESALSRATEDDAPVVVAYEPLWAIGADKPASEAHIAEVCDGLRDYLASTRSKQSDRVIYGGSAGPGLFERLGHSVDGLFLGRYVHNTDALEGVLKEAGRVVQGRH